MATAADSPVLPGVRDALAVNAVALKGDNGESPNETDDGSTPALDEANGDHSDDLSPDDDDEGYTGWGDDKSLPAIGEEEEEDFYDEGLGDEIDEDGEDSKDVNADWPAASVDDGELRKEQEDFLDYKIEHYRKQKVEELQEKAEEFGLSEVEIEEYKECGGDMSKLAEPDEGSTSDPDTLSEPLGFDDHDDDDLSDLSSPPISPADSPEASSPFATEYPFTDASRQITQALGMEGFDGPPTDSQRALFMEQVTRRLITGSDFKKELTGLRKSSMLAPEEEEMLEIIEAASKIASQKEATSKEDWIIDSRSGRPPAEQASINAVYTIWENSSTANSDKWEKAARKAVERLSEDEGAQAPLLRFNNDKAAACSEV